MRSYAEKRYGNNGLNFVVQTVVFMVCLLLVASPALLWIKVPITCRRCHHDAGKDHLIRKLIIEKQGGYCHTECFIKWQPMPYTALPSFVSSTDAKRTR
jgi:uncharacterized membrane protein YhaH (DUF805 family)